MDFSKVTRAVRKMLPLRYCGAVIVAAGTASRMGGIDQVMAQLGGEELILRSVRAFQNCDAIREIVVVTREDLIVEISRLCKEYRLDKVRKVIVGGAERTNSVRNGLREVRPDAQLIAIHDGARPLISWQVIDRVVRAANTYGAAAPAVPVRIR